MSINQRLDIKQSQTLAMTPQLQQAIKLLQMSNLELSEFVEAELEKNPLLERDDSMSSERTEDSMSSEKHDDNMSSDKHDDTSSDKSSEENFDGGGDDIPVADLAPQRESAADENAGDRGELDTDFDNVFTGESRAEGGGEYDALANKAYGDVGKGGGLKFEDPDYSLENTVAKEASLRDHLTGQIQLEFDDTKDRGIALLLLDYLDESGYCRADLKPLAERLGCDISRIEQILLSLQGLDPAGVFARNLSECLAIQLREKNRLDPAMEKLLAHLDVLAGHDLKKLKTICGVDEDDLKDMILEIKSLNPKPAIEFDHFVAQTVIPDVYMKPLPKSKGGGWAVELNNDTLPRVLLNKTYYTEINKSAKSKQDKEYLSEQMNTASWLIKALDQRAQTILKTASEIIEQQEAFFNYGVEFLKPLVLKDVSDAISMHESTVSRVTTNKYIGTPRGVFEMKYFFTSGLSSTDGGNDLSSEAVKAKIKNFIDAEKPAAILSDDDLVELLKKDGIEIARRTVAKYREAMKIPSSVQRRRLKNS